MTIAAVTEAAPSGDPLRENLWLVVIMGLVFSAGCGYLILTQGWPMQARSSAGWCIFP